MMRAIFEWCVDNGFTPYLVARVDAAATVPMQFVRDGQIVLNISYEATNGLKMDNESVLFNARFGGVAREIFIPVENVVAIYAHENGQGMVFEAPEQGAPGKPSASSTSSGDGPEPPKKGGPPTLTRIK